MPLPVFEVAVGAIDGVNLTFAVSRAYQPESLAVWLNGLLLGTTGWIETVPATGAFQLVAAPLVGDVVQAFFLDTSPVLPGVEIALIGVTLSTDPDDLVADLIAVSPLDCELEPVLGLTGDLDAPSMLFATLVELVELHATIEVV